MSTNPHTHASTNPNQTYKEFTESENAATAQKNQCTSRRRKEKALIQKERIEKGKVGVGGGPDRERERN